ncbi:molybdate ABC transporter substrate-binding protein [Stenotrophomonas sp. YIM B06876]|uniref:molybdate ABC transporter substrate-binding protein n=1 Tax=Stenotrophomonas sp. YIM B06876 TaxID=3060211 RepID=UPI00273987D9|nr:molybdate ABC transporter substrate-binding protein [Stenotrophomonas sp. YIM B06876]
MGMNPCATLRIIGLLLFSAAAQAGELTVSAAASLGTAFTDIARAYEQQYPGTRVHLNTAASGALMQQIVHGAPVDVLATADEFTMDQASERGLVIAADRHVFIANTLVVVVPKAVVQRPAGLAQLALPRIRTIALGNPDSVPAGRYARGALEAAGLWSVLADKLITTQNVRQALDYVARGEVDAGFVYGSDARTLRERVTPAFRVPTTVPIHYPIAPVASSRQPQEARRFIAFVRSQRSRDILLGYGFVAAERHGDDG